MFLQVGKPAFEVNTRAYCAVIEAYWGVVGTRQLVAVKKSAPLFGCAASATRAAENAVEIITTDIVNGMSFKELFHAQ